MIRSGFCYSLGFMMIVMSGAALPIGLGEIRGQPVIGEELQLQVDLLGEESRGLDASCFHLVRPVGIDDQPWLKNAALTLRGGGGAAALEIRSRAVLREPILNLAVYLGCGYEMTRSYALLVSPAPGGLGRPEPASVREASLSAPLPLPPEPAVRRFSRPKVGGAAPVARRLFSPTARGSQPRLLVGGGYELRLSTEIDPRNLRLIEAGIEPSPRDARLLALRDEQARAEAKLRNMEATFVELEKRSAEFALRVENGVVAAPLAEAPVAVPAPVTVPAVEQAPAPAAKVPVLSAELPQVLSEWGIYGALLGALAGLGGWLGWRAYRRRALMLTDDELILSDDVDFVMEEADFSAENADVVVRPEAEPASADQVTEAVVKSPPVDSVFSSFDTTATLDERFTANPVMELADIMLSFGRVKGAAQALQEYVDHNPQEALQPWLRLMSVYRMAGMRTEFETVTRNLNKYFNVELQPWDDVRPDFGLVAGSGETSSAAGGGPQSVEEMPRLMNCVVDLWTSGDVVGYLYELLRDNRGGQRAGFSLPVVEDILFLIELKETVNRME